MFQQDYGEIAFRSSDPVYRPANHRMPLWLHAWGALRSAAGSVARTIARVVDSLERQRREAVTVRELSALRDRELRDIGIDRSEIRFIARTMAQDQGDPRKQAGSNHAARRTLKLVTTPEPMQPCCG